MVPDFRKANWKGFVGKMINLNWEYLFQGKNTYEIQNIFKSLLNNFTKQFIPMKKNRNNKGVKPKWMNGRIKRLIREPKIAYQTRKTKSSEAQATFAKQERGNQEKLEIYIRES